MANIFYTKKAKAMMRKRRRKMDIHKSAVGVGGVGEGVGDAGVDQDGYGHRDHDDVTISVATADDDDNDIGIASRIMNGGGGDGGRKRTSDHISHGRGEGVRRHAMHEPVDGKNGSKSNNEQTTIVIIPRDLPPKDAKKFRKDARRKARSEGYSEDAIAFVVEGERNPNRGGGGGGPTSSSSSSSSSTAAGPSSSGDTRGREDGDESPRAREEREGPKKNNNKKSHPRINDILIQHAADVKLKERLARQRSANDVLTATERSKYVAVDCEMVGIGPDGKKSALARVSVVDWECNVLLDSYVRVPERVTDFRTRVSGVRPRDISASNDNAMDHDEARIAVGNILLGKILVGHALKNDLSALMLSHPRDEIRDTARYAPFMRPSGTGGGKLRPRKLRDLVYENLGRRIQVEGESHCSVDDARATMELFQLVRGRWEKELQQKSSSGGKRGR